MREREGGRDGRCDELEGSEGGEMGAETLGGTRRRMGRGAELGKVAAPEELIGPNGKRGWEWSPGAPSARTH